MASATESESAGLNYNYYETAIIRNTLEEIGYSQPPTSIKLDNLATDIVVNETV